MGEGLREKQMAQPQRETGKSLEGGTVHRPLIGVACPSPEKHFPGGGGRNHQSHHRRWQRMPGSGTTMTASTGTAIYIQLQHRRQPTIYRLSVLIIPVPESMSKYQITYVSHRTSTSIGEYPNPPA